MPNEAKVRFPFKSTYKVNDNFVGKNVKANWVRKGSFLPNW